MKFEIISSNPFKGYKILNIKEYTSFEQHILCAKMYCIYKNYILGDGTIDINICKINIPYHEIKAFIAKL